MAGVLAAGVVLLGGFLMSAAHQDAIRSSRGDQIDRALSLMGEALNILDDLGDVAELAARLDEIAERLKDARVAGSSLPPAFPEDTTVVN